MENDGHFDVNNPVHLFASSTVGCSIAQIMLQRFIGSWNHRSVPRKWKPADYIPYKSNYMLPNGALPTVPDAVKMYRNTGHSLMDQWSFGTDPLESQHDKQRIRDQTFWYEVEMVYGGVKGLANQLAQHQYSSFHICITRFIELSYHFL